MADPRGKACGDQPCEGWADPRGRSARWDPDELTSHLLHVAGELGGELLAKRVVHAGKLVHGQSRDLVHGRVVYMLCQGWMAHV